MNLEKSGNPILKDDNFKPISFDRPDTEVMSLQGTINKIGLLLLFVAMGAMYAASYTSKVVDLESFAQLRTYTIVCSIAAFICAIVLSFKPLLGSYLAPLYAILEGVALGFISAFANFYFPGIAMQALVITLGIFGVMFFLYKFRILQATPMFTKIVMVSTIGIAAVYLISFVARMFGTEIPYIHDGSPIGIGISLFIIVIAALNFVLDFHFIEESVAKRAPKEMEWFGAFGVLVTLVWLYIEVLRLLMKLNSRD